MGNSVWWRSAPVSSSYTRTAMGEQKWVICALCSSRSTYAVAGGRGDGEELRLRPICANEIHAHRRRVKVLHQHTSHAARRGGRTHRWVKPRASGGRNTAAALSAGEFGVLAIRIGRPLPTITQTEASTRWRYHLVTPTILRGHSPPVRRAPRRCPPPLTLYRLAPFRFHTHAFFVA